MTGTAQILTECVMGEMGMGQYTGGRLFPHTKRSPSSPTTYTNRAAGRMAAPSKIGYVELARHYA